VLPRFGGIKPERYDTGGSGEVDLIKSTDFAELQTALMHAMS
jgi:hypothetical protein